MAARAFEIESCAYTVRAGLPEREYILTRRGLPSEADRDRLAYTPAGFGEEGRRARCALCARNHGLALMLATGFLCLRCAGATLTCAP